MWLTNRTLPKGIKLFDMVTPKLKHAFSPAIVKALGVKSDVIEGVMVVVGSKKISDVASEKIVNKTIGAIVKVVT